MDDGSLNGHLEQPPRVNGIRPWAGSSSPNLRADIELDYVSLSVGRVAERFKAHAWKACGAERLS